VLCVHTHTHTNTHTHTVLKLLQIQPEKEIVVEFIKNEDFKYVRALGAFYMRMVGKPLDVYQVRGLENTFYTGYRKHSMENTFYIEYSEHSFLCAI
jgi:hypothetical protein